MCPLNFQMTSVISNLSPSQSKVYKYQMLNHGRTSFLRRPALPTLFMRNYWTSCKMFQPCHLRFKHYTIHLCISKIHTFFFYFNFQLAVFHIICIGSFNIRTYHTSGPVNIFWFTRKRLTVWCSIGVKPVVCERNSLPWISSFV